MTHDPNTPTTDPTSPAPASPQSVRIETTLWWEDESKKRSWLRVGSMTGRAVATILEFRGTYSWKESMTERSHEDETSPFIWHSAPTREAAKAAALQAVMGAIGAREVPVSDVSVEGSVT